jgi:hypothetical protein
MASGFFDETVLPGGWFDEETALGGWFDEDILHTVTTIIPGVGPDGVATLVLDLDSGTKVTYTWSTNVIKSMSGDEQRVSLSSAPSTTFSGSALLSDEDDRVTRAKLAQYAAGGSPFLLALPYEMATIITDAASTVVSVSSTTLLDWCQNGQRVVVVNLDGTGGFGVIQSSNATTITLEQSVTSKKFGSVMPTTAVYFTPQQGLQRYPVNATSWSVDARSSLFGWGGVDVMGRGSTLTTFLDPNDSVTYIVFDYGLAASGEQPAADSMQAMNEIIDFGSTVQNIGFASEADWGRDIRITATSVARWQWFKNFLFSVRGRDVAFLLPTWRPDMVFVSAAGSDIRVQSSSVAGAGDVLAWMLHTVSHSRFQATYADGSVQYLSVSDAADNLDGTVSLTCNGQALTGTPVMLSFLELVRLDSDEIDVIWSSFEFSSQLPARTVQA